MIVIVDYKLSNLNAVLSAVKFLGYKAEITNEISKIKKATKIILPGVGAFGDAMKNLNNLGLINILNEQVLEKKIPFLGICVGAQLICKNSDEFGFHNGLGWIDAYVKKISVDNSMLRLPHTGWDELEIKNKISIFDGIKQNDHLFYYNHSHAIYSISQKNVVATCNYGHEFVSVVNKENIYATQFHPEKSQKAGLIILKNFLRI